MKASLTSSALVGVLSVFLFSGIHVAAAEDNLAGKIDTALAAKNIADVQGLLAKGPGNVDTVLRALLKKTQKDMSFDPAFSTKMMSLAGEYAPQITPPTVPAVCADMRRIVAALGPNEIGTELFNAVVSAAETLSKAPVVVAAGRPNECEAAWLQASNAAEDALLFQTPGMSGPGLPPSTIRPGIPPNKPTPEDKPSAD